MLSFLSFSFSGFFSCDSGQFVEVKPLVCHKGTNLSAILFQPKLGTWPLTCSPCYQDQHPGQLRHGSVVLTTSPLNIDDTVSVLHSSLVHCLLKRQQTGTCLAGFNCTYIPVWWPVCIWWGMDRKWNKSQMLFSTQLFFLFPPLLLHSTLLPLSSFYWLSFLPPTTIVLSVLFLLYLMLTPTLLTLLSLLLALFSPLLSPSNALWDRRLLAIFTKSKVIRNCWKQEKNF